MISSRFVLRVGLILLALGLQACGSGGSATSSVGSTAVGPGQIDLAVTVVADNSAPREQQLVSFTVTIMNSNMGVEATGVRVGSPLAVGFDFSSATLSQGNYNPTTGEWIVGKLGKGVSATLFLRGTVSVGTGGQSLLQSATVTAADQVDPNPSQDTGGTTVVVDANADLDLVLALDDLTPTRFQPLAITLTLSNKLGGAQASNVVVQLTLPASLSFASFSPLSGSFDASSSRWTVPLVESGSDRELVVTALLDNSLGGTAVNVSASIVSVAQPDPDSSGNSAAGMSVIVTENIELVRDRFGIPHVFATSDQGAYFGAGVTTAEDRLSQLIAIRLSFEGQLAQFYGRGVNEEFLDSDRRARLYGFARQSELSLAQLDPEMRSLLNAFAEGVNSVIARPGTTLHALLTDAGVPMTPWSAEDSIATWSYLGRLFGPSPLAEAKRLHDFEDVLASVGGDMATALAQYTTPIIPDDSAAVVKQSDVPAALQQAMSDYATSVAMTFSGRVLNKPQVTPKFSHSWVLSGARTTDGKSVLVTDPRLPLGRPANLYEMHIRGESFDVRGATLPGCVNLLVGQSPTTVWGASALGVDQEDLFRLTVEPVLNPGMYMLDGAFVPFDFQQIEEIQILGEASIFESYRESKFGPVVTPVVNDVDSGEEYAVRRADSAEFGEDSSLGFLRMYRAANVDDFGSALEFFRIPSTNMIFSDFTGRIGFRANGSMAVRSSSQPNAELAGRVAQEGDKLSSDWVDMVPHALKPSVIDPADGLLITANHMPVGSWYPIDIKAGTGATGESARSIRLRELIDALPQRLDRDEVLSPHFDLVNWPQRELVKLALQAELDLGLTYSVNANAALQEAEAWLIETGNVGLAGDKNNAHRGVALASNLEVVLRKVQSAQMVSTYGAGAAATIFFLKQKLAELDANGSITLQAFEISWLDGLLAKAWTDTNAAYGPPANWAGAYASADLTINTPAFELLGQVTLDPLDVLTLGPLTCTDSDTLLSQSGQSFTMRAVPGELDTGIAVLPFGQTEPGMIHDMDQTPLFEDLLLRPAPMTKTGISNLVGPTTETILIF